MNQLKVQNNVVKQNPLWNDEFQGMAEFTVVEIGSSYDIEKMVAKVDKTTTRDCRTADTNSNNEGNVISQNNSHVKINQDSKADSLKSKNKKSKMIFFHKQFKEDNEEIKNFNPGSKAQNKLQ